MTRYERTKVWVKNNQDALVAVGFIVAVVGAFALVLKVDLARLAKQNAELDAVIDSLNEWYVVEQAAKNSIFNHELNELIALENQDLSERVVELTEKLAKKAA